MVRKSDAWREEVPVPQGRPSPENISRGVVVITGVGKRGSTDDTEQWAEHGMEQNEHHSLHSGDLCGKKVMNILRNVTCW